MSRIIFIVCVSLLSVESSLGEPSVEFNRDVRPILSDRCFACHGPDEESREADLRLDDRESATHDLGGYRAIAEGDPERSELMQRVSTAETKIWSCRRRDMENP